MMNLQHSVDLFQLLPSTSESLPGYYQQALSWFQVTLAVAHEWQRLRRSMAVSDSGDGRRLQTAATEGGCGRRQRMAIADGSDGRQLRMASSSGENIEERREEFGVYMLRKIIRNKTLS
nr:hypothetical protein Iba_scaffold52056CG0010 [Ipomoea batatas]